MSFSFAQLLLDNTVRAIKTQFECDLFKVFNLKDSKGKVASIICENFSAY